MSETRSGGARKRAKAKARAAAAAAAEPKTRAATAAETATPVAEPTPAKPKGKQAKKGKAAVEAPPATPSSPSPPKKKKRKRIHKRKGSVVEMDAEAKPAAPQPSESTPKAEPRAKAKRTVRAVVEPAPTPSPEAAPVAKRTRKRKNRSGSIHVQQDGEEPLSKTATTTAEDRKDVHVTPVKQVKQASMENTPKSGRTTRASLAAAAAAEAMSAETGNDEDAPTSAARSKKRRKSKAARAVLSEDLSEPTPDPKAKALETVTATVEPENKAIAPEAQTPGTPMRLRKSARLANGDATPSKPSLLSRPTRKVISFAKVKGTIPKDVPDEEATPQEQDSDGSQKMQLEVEKNTTLPLPVEQLEQVEANTDQSEVSIEAPAQEISNSSAENAIARDGASVGDEGGAETTSPAPVADEQPTLPIEDQAVGEIPELDMQPPLGPADEEEAPAEAMLDGGLAFLTGRTSSVETTADNGSYQGDVLNEENINEDVMSMSSDVAGDLIAEGATAELSEANARDDPDLEDREMNDETESVGSINGSEAFTLEEAENDGETEYESLGIDNRHRHEVDSEHDKDNGDVEDEGYEQDDAVPQAYPDELASNLPQLATDTGDEAQSEADDEPADESNGTQHREPDFGLNDSFIEDEEGDSESTDSDDDVASQTETGEIEEWPGVGLPQQGVASREDEVIVLSDTDSDEDADSARQHEYSSAPENEDSEESAHSDTESHADHDRQSHSETMADGEVSRAHVHEGDEATAEPAVQYDDAHMEHSEEDEFNSSATFSSDHGALEQEDLSDDEHEVLNDITSAAVGGVSSENPSDSNDAMTTETGGPFDDEVESVTESDGTIELQDDNDEDQQSDTSGQDDEADGTAHEDHADIGQVGPDQDVPRTEVNGPVALRSSASAQQVASPKEDREVVSMQAARPTRTTNSIVSNDSEQIKQVSRAVPSGVTSSETTPITYTTTPSKHLIESVFSSTREQTLARITQEAMATHAPPPTRSSERTWGPSFGVSTSIVTQSAPLDFPSQAAASPLSSWFFSRGPANFKKRVHIPSPESPRQRVGSPRPLKMMRMESTDVNQASRGLVNDPTNAVDRFVQGLLDKSAWRAWYNTAEPDQLLDPPLPTEMIKRLGGDAAVAQFSQVSVTVPPLPPAVSSHEGLAAPKKRRRVLAELEASIQEEKKRTKAFDEELLQLLQGKTLSGKDLAVEFAPLLAPTSSKPNDKRTVV